MLSKMGESSCTGAASSFSWEVEGSLRWQEQAWGMQGAFSPYCGGMVIKLRLIWSVLMHVPIKLIFEEFG